MRLTRRVARVRRDDDGERLLLDVTLELLNVKVVAVGGHEGGGDRNEAPGRKVEGVSDLSAHFRSRRWRRK